MTDRDAEVAAPKPRTKACYVGAPAIFALHLACQQIKEALEPASHCGVYLVGSALERPDFRDVDVRAILDDAAFAALFPQSPLHSAAWELNPRWLLLNTALAAWLRERTGLPIDFQIQPMTHANERHKKPRHSLGGKVTSHD